MSSVGYYRYKVVPSAEGESTVKFYINGSLASTATVVAKKFCGNFKILKYLDSSGRYRFFPFNDRWQQKDSPKSIGSINKFVESIESSKTDSLNIGYNGKRVISMVAEKVSTDELSKLSDIFFSPRVYLYVGAGSSDNENDWILVQVSGDGIGRRKNRNYGNVTLEIELPSYNAITSV